MEENKKEIEKLIAEEKKGVDTIVKEEVKERKMQLIIAIAILLAGALIAGAVIFANTKKDTQNNGITVTTTTLAPIGPTDRVLGNKNAKVAIVLYEDFQCVFCGASSGLQPDTAQAIQYLKQKVDPTWTPFMPVIMNYVNNGSVEFVYRDYPFLGPESVTSAEAARCAGDQNKFWEYKDYLFAHQGVENSGTFSNPNLETFAKNLNLDTASFNKCLESGKYAQAVADSKTEGDSAGVNGTPKGFVLKNNKLVDTIDGSESGSVVQKKIEAALQ